MNSFAQKSFNSTQNVTNAERNFKMISLNEKLNESLEDIDTIIEIQKSLIFDTPDCDESKLIKQFKTQYMSDQNNTLDNHTVMTINSK